ncbi:MAG: pH regulation protein F [Candidatus Omnitrophica bacterium]|nr:pH regulation protein F [Candidatus Omnitrophota bacterium]
MSDFFTSLCFVIILYILFLLYRALRGPTLFDRLLAVGTMGTKTVVLICLLGFAYGRIDMFVDIAIGYALLNFIGTIAFAKYLERRGSSI